MFSTIFAIGLKYADMLAKMMQTGTIFDNLYKFAVDL